MNGLDIFQFTISEVPKAIKEHIQYFKLNIENFDYLLLHQANKFIVERIAKKVDFLIDRVPVNIDKYGNCGGTSIPLIIVDKLKDKLAECEQSVLMSGYGIGLSWGVMDLTLKSEIVSEIIFANDYFMNG